MSTVKRLASGAFASWSRIGVTFITQIGLVPIFLKHWNAEQYGVWLGIAAFTGVLTLVSIGYQTYVGNEFLRLAHTDKTQMWNLFSTSCFVGVIIATFEVLAVTILVGTGALQWVISEVPKELASQAGVVLIAQSIAIALTNCIGGGTIRLLSALGYYPRLAWWGVIAGVVFAGVPVLIVIVGGDLEQAGIGSAMGLILYNIPFLYDAWCLLKNEGIVFHGFTRSLAWESWGRSLALLARTALEMLRQQGVRLILAPVAGVSQMAAFTTIRTGANVALQGLGTITNPLMPELMRFLSKRDQARSEMGFSTVWLVVVGLLAPATLTIQGFAPEVFKWWTADKFQFDPMLFALLSLSVLVFALAQPAIAVVTGNNLLKSQLFIALGAGLVAVVGLIVSVPKWGLCGAGAALLLAELVSLGGNIIVANSWLVKNGMHWPYIAFGRVALAVGIAGVFLTFVAVCPSFRVVGVAFGLFCMLISFIYYFCSLPALAYDRINTIIIRFPGGRMLLKILHG